MSANPITRYGSWKPSPLQELLLKAGLCDGADARDAWTAWLEQSGLNTLDPGSIRLLPLVYLNLLALQVRHPAMTELRGVYRHFWSRNHVTLLRASRLVQTLSKQGIPTMVLKACALIPLYYGDPGKRPMNDIDLVVPTRQSRQALKVLHGAGWRPKLRPVEEMKDEYLERVHAHTMTGNEFYDLDLHRHVFTFETRVDGDAVLWASAIPVKLYDVETRTLSPAHQLLHTCAHGVEWNPLPPVRWVADACTILKHAPVDWQLFLKHAAELELVLVTRNMLSYLVDAFRAPIPNDVLAQLHQLPISRHEQIKYELLVRPHSEHNTALKLWYHVGQYRRVTEAYRNENWFLRFPAFLRDTWALPNTRDVPKYMMRYTANWVARRMTPQAKTAKDQR